MAIEHLPVSVTIILFALCKIKLWAFLCGISVYKKLDNCLQLFDHCLAPNTLGDGTGCDNMTAVIVQFQPELMNQDDRKAAKRSASPGMETSTDTTKRPKTEETPCV